MSKLYKVPFRECYADTFARWALWTLWCHVVLRVYPHAHDPGGPAVAS